MAKADNVSFFERHVEKLVLLICLVLLGVAVARWVLSSPVTLSVIPPTGRGAQKEATPEEVDGVLQRAAENVKEMHDEATVKVDPVPSYAGQVLSLAPIGLPQGEPIELGLAREPIVVGEVQLPGKGLQLKDLKLPAPPTPNVTAHMEVPETADPDDTITARGAINYPLGQISQAWQQKLQEENVSLAARIIFEKVVVEVQERQPDGQWGPPKEAKTTVRPDLQGQPRVVPKVPAYDGSNVQQVRDARDALGQREPQLQILQPDYYPVWTTDGGWADWRRPRVSQDPNEVAVWFHDDQTMQLDREYRYRMKLVLVNPLLTYDEEIRKKGSQDARQPTIETPFSPWSEAVSVPRQVHFFLTGASPITGDMIVTVYARKWAKTVRETFRIKPGEVIGGRKQIRIRPPGGQAGTVKTVEVDLSTGAVVLQFDYNHKMVQPGSSMQITTARFIYMDKDGKLKERVQARDSRAPTQQRLEQEAKQ